MDIDHRKIRVKNWLIKYKKIIKIRALERQLGFPASSIQKFVTEDRTLNSERILILFKYLKKMSNF